MKSNTFLKVLIIISFIAALFWILKLVNYEAQSDCGHTEDKLNCVIYVRNYDADTITFNIPNTHPIIGKKVNVRLLGIDTPELKTKFKCEKKLSKLAKRFVKDKLLNARRINIHQVSRGKYFRIVGDVMIDGKSLTKTLIDKGYGYPYFGKTKPKVDWCEKLARL